MPPRNAPPTAPARRPGGLALPAPRPDRRPMLSRLRRLLLPLPPPAGPPPARGACDWLQGQDPQHLRLIDVRSPRAAAGGVVRGSWLLPAEQLLELPLPQDLDLALLCDDVEQARRLADALRGRGLRVLLPRGRADVEAAGLAFHTPAWKSPLPPAHPIWLSDEGAGRLGLLGRLPGWVQDVRWPSFEFRYDALLLGPAGLLRLEDLPEELLSSRGPRGAAGLGELIGEHSFPEPSGSAEASASSKGSGNQVQRSWR